MNGEDRLMITRLDQKVKDIKDDVSEIKTICNTLKESQGKISIQAVKLETIMTNHLSHHMEINRQSMEANRWIRWVPSVIAVCIAGIALIYSVVQ